MHAFAHELAQTLRSDLPGAHHWHRGRYPSTDPVAQPAVAAVPDPADAPILVTPQTDAAVPAAAAAPAAASADTRAKPADRLLSAFSHLFDVLQKASGATETSAAPVDYAAKLREFLHSLKQALSPSGDLALPSSGGLLDVRA